MGRRLRSGLSKAGYGALTAVLVIPLAAAAWVFAQPTSLPGTTTRPTVLWGKPVTVSGPESLPGTLTVKTGPVPTLYAPQWSGLVTAVASPGTQITEGTPLVTIDGIARPVCSTQVPFFRPLVLGDAGPDVLGLRHCLDVVLGGTAGGNGSDDTVGGDLVTTINELATKLGARASSVFEPTWFVWAPTFGWSLTAIQAKVGLPVPPFGSELATGMPQVVGASVVVDNGGGQIFGTVASSSDRVSFAAGRVEIAVPSTGSISLAAVDAKLSQLETASGASAASGGSSGTGDGGPQAGAQASSALAGPNGSQDPAGSFKVNGSVVIDGPVRLQLPVSAVETAASGRPCVFVREGNLIRSVVVKTQPGPIGEIMVSGHLGPSSRVALNPTDLVGGPKCPN